MDQVKIIKLPPDRWEEYRNLRLLGLRNDPTAFSKTYGEEVDYSELKWREKLEQMQIGESSVGYFAEVEGKIVGFVGATFEDKIKMSHIAYIIGVIVHPDYRGQGIGRKLLTQLLNELESRPEIKKINLDVSTTQEAALNLYKSLGFEIAGELKMEYLIDGKFYDVYEMEKYLS